MIAYSTSDGDTLEFVAWKHYGTQAGQVVERVLAANPGLADRGPLLPAGVLINLPELESVGVTEGVKLWD
jgi:phage tail protein X